MMNVIPIAVYRWLASLDGLVAPAVDFQYDAVPG